VYHIDHKQNLLASAQPVCFIGDSGTGDANQLAVARALESMNCSQIRILGDIIYPSGITSANDPSLGPKFFRPYQYYLKNNIPIFLLLGNHDHQKESSAWLNVAQQHPSIYFPNYYYSENWDGICFFNLDTSYYEKIYYHQKRWPQTKWLRKALRTQRKSCDFTIASGHHPFKSSGSHGNAQWQLGWFFEDELIGKVDLYISGHDHHLSDEGEINGTRLLISGAAGLLYDLKKPSADRRFAASKLGFITLNFVKNPNKKTVANYKIYTLKAGDQNGFTDLSIAWEGQIVGGGVR